MNDEKTPSPDVLAERVRNHTARLESHSADIRAIKDRMVDMSLQINACIAASKAADERTAEIKNCVAEIDEKISQRDSFWIGILKQLIPQAIVFIFMGLMGLMIWKASVEAVGDEPKATNTSEVSP